MTPAQERYVSVRLPESLLFESDAWAGVEDGAYDHGGPPRRSTSAVTSLAASRNSPRTR